MVCRSGSRPAPRGEGRQAVTFLTTPALLLLPLLLLLLVPPLLLLLLPRC